MSEAIVKKPVGRDYSKPIIPIFQGEAGHRAYIKIATTKPTKYDAEKESKKAAEFLRRQGLEV